MKNTLHFLVITLAPALCLFGQTLRNAVPPPSGVIQPPGTGALQRTVASKLAETVSAQDFGAVCNDTNNDTAAIQSALNAVSTINTTGFGTVLLPAGQCRVTAPVIVGRYSNLRGIGNATKIHCDFANWAGTDYNCIRLTAVDPPPANFTVSVGMFGRIFGDFSMYGTGNGGIVSTALYVGMNPALAPIQYSQIVNYAVLGTRIQNIHIEDFDLGVQVCEIQSSQFDDIKTNRTRRGISVNGQAINVQFRFDLSNFYNYTTAVAAGITPFTSSIADPVGFFLDYNQSDSQFAGRYLDGAVVNVTGWPQGVTITDSLDSGAANDLIVNNVLQMTVLNSIFDLATKDAVVIGPPQGFIIENCFVFTSGSANANIRVNPVYIQNAFAHLIIRNNWFDQGNGAVNGMGVFFPDGGPTANPWVNVQIIGNRFFGIQTPINLTSGPRYSIVSDNYGDQNTGVFCYWNNYGEYSFFERNTSKDAYPMISTGAMISPTFTIGINHAPGYDTTPAMGTVNTLAQIWRNAKYSVADSSGTVAVDLAWADAIAGQIQSYKLTTTTNGMQFLTQQGANLLTTLDMRPTATFHRSTVYGSGDASGSQTLYLGFKDHNGPAIAAVKQSATKTGLAFYTENPLNTEHPVATVDPTTATWTFNNAVRIPPVTVATLTGAIRCAGGTEGYLAPVIDANSATFNAALAGGGANHVIGYCNGTGWVVH